MFFIKEVMATTINADFEEGCKQKRDPNRKRHEDLDSKLRILLSLSL